MKKAICILILIIPSISAFAQLRDTIMKDKYGTLVIRKHYIYFTMVNPPDFTRIHIIDSLIKSVTEKGIIEVVEGGDYDFKINYDIFYFNDSTLIYHANFSHNKPSPQQIAQITKKLKDTAGLNEHRVYQNTGPPRSTANLDYFFLIVSNGKIIESLVSNVSLDEIADENFKGEMELFMSIF